jgi:hypothetical protein
MHGAPLRQIIYSNIFDKAARPLGAFGLFLFFDKRLQTSLTYRFYSRI